MMFLAGVAASTALDLVSSLTKTLDEATKSAKAKHSPFQVAQSDTAPAAGSAGKTAETRAIAPGTMNALLQAQGGGGTPPAQTHGIADKLFARLDADRDDTVTSAELDAALGDKVGAEQKSSLFARFDADGSGGISRDEFATALTNYNRHHHLVAMSGKAPPAANVSASA